MVNDEEDRSDGTLLPPPAASSDPRIRNIKATAPNAARARSRGRRVRRQQEGQARATLAPEAAEAPLGTVAERQTGV